MMHTYIRGSPEVLRVPVLELKLSYVLALVLWI
jgi:hypothetical protein